MTIDKLCKQLIVTDPFWGLILVALNKEFSTNLDTLAVTKDELGYKLLINKEFWESLTETEQKACFLHELNHLCFNHLLMAKSFSDKKLFNIAADLEVNSYIEGLPKSALFPEDFGFPECQGTKWYYEQLLKKCENKSNTSNNQKQLIDSFEPLDDHEQWKDFETLSPAERELLTDQFDRIVKQAVTQSQKTCGTIPSYLSQYVASLFEEKQPQYNWKKLLKNNIGTQLTTRFKHSYKRESKRFEESRGIKLTRSANVLVAIDTSGSISQQDYDDFITELIGINKTDVNIKLITCDTEIKDVIDISNHSEITLTGGGGTLFEPVFDYYLKNYKIFNQLVFFTDGYASIDNLPNLGNKAIWVISKDGNEQDYPGKVIYMK